MDLADKVEQLEALREIGHVGEFEPGPGRRADDDRRRTRCSSRDTDGGSLLEFDPSRARVPHPRGLRKQPRAARGPPARPRSPSTTRSSVVPAWKGSRTDGARPRRDRRSTRTCPCCKDAGWRSVLAVPDVERGCASSVPWSSVGSEVGDFTEDTVRTSCRRSPASPRWPSSNARLFHELEQQDGRAPGREPAQVRVPGQHVARVAYAAQRRHRLLRGAARAHVRRHQRTPGGVPARHPGFGSAPAGSCSTTFWTCRRSRPGTWRWSGSTFSVREALEHEHAQVRERAAAHGIDARPRGRPGGGRPRRPTSSGSSRSCSTCLSNAVKFTP